MIQLLYENKEWSERVTGSGTVDKIPEEWKIKEDRIIELFLNMVK